MSNEFLDEAAKKYADEPQRNTLEVKLMERAFKAGHTLAQSQQGRLPNEQELIKGATEHLEKNALTLDSWGDNAACIIDYLKSVGAITTPEKQGRLREALDWQKYIEFRDIPQHKEVYFKPNGKYIGYVYLDEDREYTWLPIENGGSWSWYLLIAMGEALKSLNPPTIARTALSSEPGEKKIEPTYYRGPSGGDR